MKPGDMVRPRGEKPIILYNYPYFQLHKQNSRSDEFLWMRGNETGIVLELEWENESKGISTDHVRILASSGKVGWREVHDCEVVSEAG